VAARKSVVVVTSTKKNPLMGGDENGNDGAKGTDGGAPGRRARDGGGRKSVSNPLLAAGDAGSRRGKRASVSDPLLEGPGPGSGGVGDGGSSEAVRKDEVTPKRAPRASVVILGPKATENPLLALKRGQALHPGERRGAGRASVIQPNALGGVVTLTDSEGHEVVCSALAPPPRRRRMNQQSGASSSQRQTPSSGSTARQQPWRRGAQPPRPSCGPRSRRRSAS